MTNAFFLRVIAEGSVDTRKYRYLFRSGPDRGEIVRLPLYKLDTTAALTDWELVYTVR